MAAIKIKIKTALAIMVATPAFAEERPVPEFIAQLPEGMTTPEEPTPDEDNYAHEDDEWLETSLTEHQERSRNNFTAIIEPVGFAVAPIPSSGFMAGYTVAPDLLIEATYSWGGDKVAEVDYEIELSTIRSKWFWSDAGYVNTGIGRRNVRGRFTDRDTIDIGVDGDNEQVYSAVSTWVAELAVGHKWQMDHFVIGCDWLGVTYPLNNGNLVGLDTSEDHRKPARTFRRIAYKPTPQLLRLYFGSNF